MLGDLKSLFRSLRIAKLYKLVIFRVALFLFLSAKLKTQKFEVFYVICALNMNLVFTYLYDFKFQLPLYVTFPSIRAIKKNDKTGQLFDT